MLTEIDLLAQGRADFGFETTLSGRSYLRLIARLKKQGYAVHFFFLWLSSVDLALSRIKGRVSEGGHDVPEADVRRRFDRAIKNSLVLYRALADSWFLFDNSLRTPSVIALEEQGRLRIMKPDAYDTWSRNMGTLTKPPANILELPLAQRAEMALRAAVENVVEEHVRDGRPLYIWRDGKVVEVSAQELREQSTRTQ